MAILGRTGYDTFMNIRDLLTRQLSSITGWLVFAFFIVILIAILFWQSSNTQDALNEALRPQESVRLSKKIVPNSIEREKRVWRVIKSESVTFDDWGVTMRVPFGYKNQVAYWRDKNADGYWLASIETLMNDQCRIRYYNQLKATLPGLSVLRLNGSVTTINVNGKEMTIDSLYATNKVKDSNYFVIPDEIDSMRRFYQVGTYFYHDLSELNSAKLDITAQSQRKLFCGDAKILEADPTFLKALSTMVIKP